jgi:hypothetical protein
MSTDNLLRRLESAQTGVRYPDYWNDHCVVEVTQECEDIEPMGLGMKSEYRLKADVGVNFICNEAEHETALRYARAQLQRIIYSPVIEHADKAMIAVMAGNKEAAMKQISTIIAICTGNQYGD